MPLVRLRQEASLSDYKLYDVTNWYWVVADSTTQVYTSAAAAYVPVADATYVAWLTGPPPGIPSQVPSEQELWNILAPSFPQGIPAGSSAGQATIAAQRTYQDSYFTLKNASDPTKQLRWSLSGIATGTMRTWTAPDSDMEVVGKDTSQNLTNKGFGSSVSIGNFANPMVQLFGLTGATWRLVSSDTDKSVAIYDASANNHAALVATFGSLSAAAIQIPMTTPATSTTTGALQVAGGISALGSIYAQASILTTNGAVGYTGGGANVTQTGTITTGVSVGYFSGAITTVSSTLAAAGEATFTVSQGAIQANDGVFVWIKSYSGVGTPVAHVTRVVAGAFDITLSNLHASSALNAAVTIGYMILKGG